MSMVELFLVALGLSMDAFAVSISNGFSMKRASYKGGIITGLYFGIFQAGMPLIGYLLGSNLSGIVTAYDHWIAFILLVLIGAKMVKESFDAKNDSGTVPNADLFTPQNMIPMAVATSIDALAVGISFAMIAVNIVPAVTLIGVTTFTLSFIGVKAGNILGEKFKSQSELLGGVILILMGFKILLEHTGILNI